MNRKWFILLLAISAAQLSVAADFATAVMNATFKLYNPASTATCFIVRRSAPDTNFYLVTAAHVFAQAKGDTATLVLRQSQADGSFKRHDYTIHIRKDGNVLWIRHPKEDVAVLRLSEPLPVAVAALPFKAIASDTRFKAAGVNVCSPLFVLTYPERLEADSAGFPVARQGIFASPPLLPLSTNSTYLADYTAAAGDSGGPVFIEGPDGHALVVGIVIGRYHYDVRVENDYEKSLVYHPLGLGKILRAQFVRETIDLAAERNVRTSR